MLVYHGKDKQSAQELKECDVVITSYATLKQSWESNSPLVRFANASSSQTDLHQVWHAHTLWDHASRPQVLNGVHMLCCAVLCCAVLCCAVLCCAVLCCAVLCCAVLCCAVLCCAVTFTNVIVAVVIFVTCMPLSLPLCLSVSAFASAIAAHHAPSSTCSFCCE